MDVCFQCEKEIKLGDIDERFPDRCPHCGWGGGPGLPDDDPRYLIFLSLVQRAKAAGQADCRRLEPTSREFAMLEHGDQCKIENILWRISAKNIEKTVFYVRGWRVGKTRKGRLVTAGVDDDLANRIREHQQWEDQREQSEKESEERRREALDRGYFEPEDVDVMTEEDWETLSEEEQDELNERYEAIME